MLREDTNVFGLEFRVEPVYIRLDFSFARSDCVVLGLAQELLALAEIMLAAIEPTTAPRIGIGMRTWPSPAPAAAPVASIALKNTRSANSSSSSFPALRFAAAVASDRSRGNGSGGGCTHPTDLGESVDRKTRDATLEATLGGLNAALSPVVLAELPDAGALTVPAVDVHPERQRPLDCGCCTGNLCRFAPGWRSLLSRAGYLVSDSSLTCCRRSSAR